MSQGTGLSLRLLKQRTQALRLDSHALPAGTRSCTVKPKQACEQCGCYTPKAAPPNLAPPAKPTFSTEMYCLPSSVTNSWSKLAAMRAFKLSLGCAAGAAWQRLGSVRRWGRTGRVDCGDEIARRGACERYAEAATCSGADSACRCGRGRRRWRPACSAAAGRCAHPQPCAAPSIASQRAGQPLLRALRPVAPRTLSTCRLLLSSANRNSRGVIGTTGKADRPGKCVGRSHAAPAAAAGGSGVGASLLRTRAAGIAARCFDEWQ